MTFELMVVERFIPALDAWEATKNDTKKTLFTVVDESGNNQRFKLVQDIAGGASARIFKSYSRGKDALKPIAIKRIDATAFKGYEDEFVQLLNREKMAMEELSQFKNFVPEYLGYYYYAKKDEHWLAMELCDGASLFHISPFLYQDEENMRKHFPLLEKRISKNRKKVEPPKPRKTVVLKQLAAILAGAFRGLEVIHNAGFIHGDIKSGNILLCYPGIIKICDFGLTSKVKGVDEPDYHALGTLDYMAPEQMLKSLALDHGKPNPEKYKYDERIDVWAMGIIGIELLLGRTPLSELRRVDEEEFSFFLANMCKPRVIQNRGSALGFLFYLPKYHQDLIRNNLTNSISDRDLLVRRIPVLKENKSQLLSLLMRPEIYNKRPNPSLEVVKPKVNKLFSINKCLDFIGQCLFIKYSWRPSAKQLQQHPFIKSACKELQKLDSKIETISKLQKKWGERKKVWKKYQCSLTIHELFKVLEQQKEKKKEKILQETL